MPYPQATDEHLAFFEEHGWIAVEDAIDPEDQRDLVAHCEIILAKKHKMAFDWAWEEGTSKEERAFKIVQSSPTLFFPDLMRARFRTWAIDFGSALMRRPLEFWYDQLLAKPPGTSVPTRWHQDEGYWGRNLDERGLTCWMPMHDVDVTNGCMHFIDGGHRGGVLEHHLVPGVQSDLLYCEPDESRAIAVPLKLGGVTFHHSKTPHMTTANQGTEWRRALTQHLRVVGAAGEGDHYPWKIYVNQMTGERITPPSR
jgi:ectoine hydroxylase-related dioxygenase (phytanoyl-CoA dioxygenase family)